MIIICDHIYPWSATIQYRSVHSPGVAEIHTKGCSVTEPFRFEIGKVKGLHKPALGLVFDPDDPENRTP